MGIEDIHNLLMPEADPESHVDFTVIELKDAVSADDESLEHCFESHEADEAETDMAIKYYQSLLVNKAAFIGNGNAGFVFRRHPDEEDSSHCVKCRWDFLMVNNKSKRDGRLPAHLQPLKSVERYFGAVADKRRLLKGKGFEEVPENKTIREAVIQHLAHRIVIAEGLGDCIPDANFVMRIEREESGKHDGDTYAVSENVDLVFMDQVPGINIEQLVYSPAQTVIDRLDVEAFSSKLMEIVSVLHKNGIAHRDLSIRNIMIDSDTMLPWVIDFGKSAYSRTLSEDDIQRDTRFVGEAISLLKKLKADPKGTSADLRQAQEE